MTFVWLLIYFVTSITLGILPSTNTLSNKRESLDASRNINESDGMETFMSTVRKYISGESNNKTFSLRSKRQAPNWFIKKDAKDDSNESSEENDSPQVNMSVIDNSTLGLLSFFEEKQTDVTLDNSNEKTDNTSKMVIAFKSKDRRTDDDEEDEELMEEEEEAEEDEDREDDDDDDSKDEEEEDDIESQMKEKLKRKALKIMESMFGSTNSGLIRNFKLQSRTQGSALKHHSGKKGAINAYNHQKNNVNKLKGGRFKRRVLHFSTIFSHDDDRLSLKKPKSKDPFTFHSEANIDFHIRSTNFTEDKGPVDISIDNTHSKQSRKR
ncbi:hypothetical protein Ahia01_000511900 [Argonauta hians]